MRSPRCRRLAPCAIGVGSLHSIPGVNAVSEKEGILRMQSSGRWAVCRPGHDPVEILSGALFRVEIDGELRVTRMEHLWSKGYYSVDGYKLRDGMRAAIGSRD